MISLFHFQIDGGSFLSVKLQWSQKLSYRNGEFFLNVPFKFPEYVTPAIKKIPKKEKILLNVNAGTGSEVLCKTISHPLKVHVCLVLSWIYLNFYHLHESLFLPFNSTAIKARSRKAWFFL